MSPTSDTLAPPHRLANNRGTTTTSISGGDLQRHRLNRAGNENGSGQESGQEVYLRLGDRPTRSPPLAGLSVEPVGARANMNTASNTDSKWLFPGGRAGQPLTPGALRQRFQALGLPTIPVRTAALSQLVLQAPAPVVAAALGYHDNTAEQHRLAAGGGWSRYTSLPR